MVGRALTAAGFFPLAHTAALGTEEFQVNVYIHSLLVLVNSVFLHWHFA